MLEWRKCSDWPEYEVSENGDVRRAVRRKGNVGLRKPYLTKSGYFYIVMRRDGEKKAEAVHRLVAKEFLPRPKIHEIHVAHKDGDKAHNRHANLKWCDRSENEMDKVGHGRSNRGARQGRSRLNANAVVHIRQAIKKGCAQEELSAVYDVARTTISSIATGKSWAWL